MENVKRITLPMMSLAIASAFTLAGFSTAAVQNQPSFSIGAAVPTISETTAATEAFLGTIVEEQRKNMLGG